MSIQLGNLSRTSGTVMFETILMQGSNWEIIFDVM